MRLIDADELIKELLKWGIPQGFEETERDYWENKMMEQIVDTIDNQPTVNEWVPCSERLPEELQDVLISTKFNIVIAYHDDDMWLSDLGRFSEREVLAWMPLPLPFKEDKNGEI